MFLSHLFQLVISSKLCNPSVSVQGSVVSMIMITITIMPLIIITTFVSIIPMIIMTPFVATILVAPMMPISTVTVMPATDKQDRA